MKRFVNRACAWLCTLCLLLCLLPSSGEAVLSGVYFTAINDQLLEMTQETMPFWSEGKIYVSNAVFDEAYRKDLAISYSRSTDRQTVVLYTARNALYFVPSIGACYDNRGNTYTAKAVERGNYVFFPLETICRFFGLTYSYTATSLVPLVRIKNSSAVLSDAVFIDAATSYMRTRYNAYEKAVLESQAQAAPRPPETTDPGISSKGQKVALGVQVTDETATKAVLAQLKKYEMQGTFLLTADQAEEMPDLVRSLVGGRQTIALQPTAETPAEAVEELRRGQDALWRAACASTRMVYLTENQEKLDADLSDAGFRRITFGMDYSVKGVDSANRARTVLERMATRRGEITLLLGPDNLCGGLGTLLQGLRDGDYKVVGSR